MLGGGLMAFWFLGLGERILPEGGREWWDWTILGVFQVIIPNTLTVYALSEITTSLALADRGLDAADRGGDRAVLLRQRARDDDAAASASCSA